MKQYFELVQEILTRGVDKQDRTGTGTISIFGHQSRYDLSKGFPLVTSKKVHFKSIVHELLWFISGETNIQYLQKNGVRIWNEWADKDGNLGLVYGYQWRHWPTYRNIGDGLFDEGREIDQLKNAIRGIRKNPDSRRHIVTAWNPADLTEMQLPPCHILYQFYVAGGKLSCQMYQRSCDVFLGVPFNIASYALLTHLVAQVCSLGVGDFIHTLGDAHIYKNHLPQIITQLERDPRPLPTLELNPDVRGIDDFKYEDIRLVGYDPHPHIKGEVSV